MARHENDELATVQLVKKDAYGHGLPAVARGPRLVMDRLVTSRRNTWLVGIPVLDPMLRSE